MLRYNTLIRRGILVMFAALLLPVSVYGRTLERIQSTGVFNIGYVSDQAPLSFTSTDNSAVGYSVELGRNVVDEVKAKLGLTSLNVKFTPVTLEEGLKMVADEKLDMLCGAVSDTLKRREQVAFSLPVFVTGTAAMVRKDASPDLISVLKGGHAYTGPIWRGNINRALARRTFAVHGGTTTEEWLRDKVKTLDVVSTIVTVDEHAKGVEMVANKKADAYFADRVILENYVAGSKKDKSLMIIDRYFTYELIALVTPRNDDDFRLVVDTALSRLYTSGGIVQAYSRYFGDPGDATMTLFKLVGRD